MFLFFLRYHRSNFTIENNEVGNTIVLVFKEMKKYFFKGSCHSTFFFVAYLIAYECKKKLTVIHKYILKFRTHMSFGNLLAFLLVFPYFISTSTVHLL